LFKQPTGTGLILNSKLIMEGIFKNIEDCKTSLIESGFEEKIFLKRTMKIINIFQEITLLLIH
jgi:hypothetical protein